MIKNSIIKLFVLFTLIGTILIGSTNSYFNDVDTLNSNTASAGCWGTTTTPELKYPTNGFTSDYIWSINPYFDWNDSVTCSSKTVSYIFEIYRYSNLSGLVYQSGLLNDSIIQNSAIFDISIIPGSYYWRVRSFDGDAWSDWSNTWTLNIPYLDLMPTSTPIPTFTPTPICTPIITTTDNTLITQLEINITSTPQPNDIILN
jgi:predicted ribosomally synthesized peptide with SipW-like signal peptide